MSDWEREMSGLWLSRVMLNMFVGWEPETRTLDEFLADHESERSVTDDPSIRARA